MSIYTMHLIDYIFLNKIYSSIMYIQGYKF